MEKIQVIKHRDILFNELHEDCEQARTAAMSLADVPGVVQAQVISSNALRVSYNLLELSLEQIEVGLQEAGFHLSNTLLSKLRRALHYYLEDTRRANVGCGKGESNCTRKVFIERYKHIRHGCRDDRPEQWRRYL
ncbi:MAG: hypothetical protein ABFS23_00520 [Pseudomonadota bacterium]